jgi:hypothetical protein
MMQSGTLRQKDLAAGTAAPRQAFRLQGVHIIIAYSSSSKREDIMKLAVLGICLATLALGACRREAPVYEPMKLGATADAGQH